MTLTFKMRRLKQQRTYEVALSKAGLGPVAGVDEAGRGACCGPITIAACILPDRIIPELDKLTDSKKLSPATREKLFPNPLPALVVSMLLWPLNPQLNDDIGT